MNLIPVSSSAIAAVGYNPQTQNLKIRFVNGYTVYDFCNVPQHIYDGLMAAGSKGGYYRRFIRGKYLC